VGFIQISSLTPVPTISTSVPENLAYTGTWNAAALMTNVSTKLIFQFLPFFSDLIFGELGYSGPAYRDCQKGERQISRFVSPNETAKVMITLSQLKH